MGTCPAGNSNTFWKAVNISWWIFYWVFPCYGAGYGMVGLNNRSIFRLLIYL